MIGSMQPNESFGQANFGSCQLGDRRRTSRLVRLADQILSHPDQSLPNKCQSPADYRALCRLVNQPRVTHGRVLQAHARRVLDQMRSFHRPLLLIHDTTELDYSGQHTLAPGPIGNGGGQGYECHNSLAVEPLTRLVLGLANQVLHRRRRVPGKEGVAAKRAHPDRESRLWVRAVAAIGPAPEGGLWIDVCDRGADLFEFLQYECRHGRSFVIRSTHSRALELEEGDPGPHLLHDRLRQQPALTAMSVELPGRPGRPERTAKLRCSFLAVRLKAPHVKRGEHGREALAVWAIRVWEVDAPEGAEPVEWLLLTNVAVQTAEQLLERVGWYATRGVVEEYHKAQKTGVKIESLQFQSRAGLEPVIGLLSVVAVALLNLRVAARQEETAQRPAREPVGPLWVEVLSTWRHQEAREMTVTEFTLALARLGGHQNRKCDGLPGWLTLWRGWNKLHAMIDYELARHRRDSS